MPVTSFSLTEIELTERRRLEQPLLLLILLGTCSFALAEGNIFYLFSGVLAVGVNYMAVRHHKEIYLRRRAVNLAVLAATALIVLEYVAGSSTVPLVTVGHFMALIQLCKLFERKRARDYVQLLALNMLLMVTTALLTSAFWFALVLFAYILLMCYVAMVFTLKRGLDRAAEAHLPTESGPLSPRQVAWNVSRNWPTRSIRIMLLRVLVPTLLTGLIAFLIIPRTTLPLSESMMQQAMSSAGFDPTVRLGGRKEIYLSDRLVGWVQISEAGRPGPGRSASCRYLRASVLDKYADSIWSDTNVGSQQHVEHLPTPSNALTDRAITHRITTLAEIAPILVAPYPTYSVSVEGRLHSRASVQLTYQLAGTMRPGDLVTYTCRSWPQPLTAEQCRWLASLDVVQGQYAQPSQLEIDPADAQRIRDLTRQWAGDLLDRRAAEPEQVGPINLQIARRIAGHLRREYPYTLDLTDASADRDGVVDFLFHLRKGHCEYFASVLAVMCSLEGIPARVATGFMVSDYDDDEQRYTIRQRDAHAWCEIYTPQTDWAILDATPAAGRDAVQGGSDWMSGFSDFLLTMRLKWNEFVVRFDREAQKRILSKLGQAWTNARTWLGECWEAIQQSFLRLLREGVVDRLLRDVVIVIVLLSFGLYGLHLVRRSRRQAADAADPAKRCRLKPLQQLLALLEKRGLHADPEQTVRETLDMARERFALPPGPLESLLALQYRWRWGGAAPTPEEIDEAREQFRFAADALEAVPIQQQR